MSHRVPKFAPLTAVLAAALLAGCAQPGRADLHADVRVDAPARVWTPPPAISVYVEPPLAQPEPVLVNVAPPPMLVEAPPPPPMPDAVWVGGYWGWQGRWVWCAGRWLPPPQPGYHWTQPYYEHRDSGVVYVAGHWAAAGVSFAPPAPGLHLSLQVSIAGGEAPIGPPGVFIPPPPGSRPGLIVPAPIGTPPAVVVSAPPVVNVGMRVTNNVTNNISHTTTTINNVTNITNVTVIAPPGATASGQAFRHEVPAQAHLAAALPAMVHAQAPRPASPVPVASFDAHPARPAAPPEPHAAPAVGHPPEFAPPPMRAAAEVPANHPQPAQDMPRAQPAAAHPAPLPAAHPAPARPEAMARPAEGPRHEMPAPAHHEPPAEVRHASPPPARPATPPAPAHAEGLGDHRPPHKDDERERHEHRGEEAR